MLSIAIAAVCNFILGGLWFGPVFGKKWMQAGNIISKEMTPELKRRVAWSYVAVFAGSFLMAYVLASLIGFHNAYFLTSGAWAGISVGIFLWLGLVLPVTIGVVLWEGKSVVYWAYTYVYYLVGFMLMGGIIGAWM